MEIDNSGFINFAVYTKESTSQIRGYQVFNSLVENYKLRGIKYNGFRGLWARASDNTKTFNKYLLDRKGVNKELVSDDFKAAAFETWSGKRVKEQGFENVKIDLTTPKSGPPFTYVNVTFY